MSPCRTTTEHIHIPPTPAHEEQLDFFRQSTPQPCRANSSEIPLPLATRVE